MAGGSRAERVKEEEDEAISQQPNHNSVGYVSPESEVIPFKGL